MTVPREAWSRLRDVTGEPIEIWADSGGVWLDSGGLTVLDADQREAFAQAWIAACHKADDQVRPAPCGAVSPYAAPPCGQVGVHAEHIARGPGGIVLASWPVGDGAQAAPPGELMPDASECVFCGSTEGPFKNHCDTGDAVCVDDKACLARGWRGSDG